MLERRIRTRHLICFLEVARTGSVGAAAEFLGVSQPAVTRSIKELEELVQVPLFDRSKRGMAPTPYGRTFLHYARGSIAHLREGLAQVASVRDAEIGRVSVGVLPTAMPELLPEALRRMKSAAGRIIDAIIVDGTSSTLIPLLKAGEIDMMVGRHGDPDQLIGLSFEHLYLEKLSCVVRPGHPALTHRELTLQDLLGHTWIIPPGHPRIRHEIQHMFNEEKLPLPQDRIESIAFQLNRTYILRSDAIFLGPRGVFAEEVRSGRLAELPIAISSAPAPIGITSRADSTPTPTASLLISHLRQTALGMRRRYGLDLQANT